MSVVHGFAELSATATGVMNFNGQGLYRSQLVEELMEIALGGAQ